MGTAYVLGHPVGHSLSPAMHNAAFSALGLLHRYEALDVAPGALGDAVERLRLPAVLGANVTVPHKEQVMAFLDSVVPEAKAIGAVNTIVKSGPRLVGHNTDRAGFVAALAEHSVAVAGRRVLVLGAGGAARAAVPALRAAGADVLVANRHESRAVTLVTELGGSVVPWPETFERIDLLVNATSIGLAGEDLLATVPIPSSLCVFDLVPTAVITPFLRRAKAAGCVTVDGLVMLLHQAAASFTLWTGENAPITAMRAALPRRV